MNRMSMIRLALLLLFCFSALLNYAQSCSSFPGTFTLSQPTAAQIQSAQVTLTWGTSSNAEQYTVHYKRSNVSTFTAGPNVTDTDATLTGLVPGAQYNIKIEASYWCEGTEPMDRTRDSNTITITMDALSTPTGLTNTDVQQTTFTADWNNVEGATGYSIELYNGAILIYSSTSSISEKAISDPDITAGNSYSWRVKATGAGSTQSSFSPGKSLLMRPPTPSGLSASGQSATGFTASWSNVIGETGYRLDVSTSGSFTSFVSGFNNLNVGAFTSKEISGLVAGTTYHYRVRSENGSGVSGHSSPASTITLTNAPSLQSVQNVTQTSFTARWATTTGASSYRLDVSLDNFASILTGYNDLTVSTTSKSVEGLVPGTVYKYRVRAVNSSGASVSSSPGEITLVPTEPTAQAATNISATTFTANWSDVNGESGYRLDVSTVNDFLSFVSGYQNRLISSGTTFEVTGLNSGTTYYYRVRAENANGVSGDSAPIELITSPSAPVATDATSITTSSFVANWHATTGATSYQLDVSADNFSTVLAGYNNLGVSGTSHLVEGLSIGLTYTYRLRAVNSGGISGNSNPIDLITNPDVVATIAPTQITHNSFRANWTAMPNVTGYRLDVSADDFATLLSGYSDRAVTENFETVVGLIAGTTYKYRVRSVNESGISANSNATSALLLPAGPAALEVIKQQSEHIGQTYFKARWNAVPSATAYRLDVSTQENFQSYVHSYENRLVDGSLTSFTVDGLNAGTVYFFRLKAVNASGISNDFSNVVSVETIPAAPTLNSPIAITATSLTLSWSASAGSTSYFVDVATNNAFTNFVLGFQNTATTSTSLNVNGLSAGFTYYMRIRASNASGLSTNSNTIDQVTIPLTLLPQNITERDKTATTITINWPQVTGAVFYEVQVATDQEFANPLEEYNTRRIEELNELVIQGLHPQTSYFVRMKSGNSAGISAFSNPKIITTLNQDNGGGGGEISELAFGSPVFNSIFTTGNQVQIELTGGMGQRSVLFHHRTLTGTDFETEVITSASNTQSISINDAWLDVLGMEFYFTATDEAEQLVTTATHLIRQNVTTAAIPVPSTGGTLKDYRIIALPYQVENDVIENILEPELGAYNPAKWRLVRYQNGKNVDYTEGLSKLRMERGQGFWFNAMGGAQINLRSPEITPNSQQAPFELALKAGWNQIGNPYPFAIDWTAVMQHNGNPEVVGSLLTYNAEQISLMENTTLQVYEGGFIHAEEDIHLTIPVTMGLPLQSSARVLAEQVNHTNDTKAWFIPITLVQGELQSSLGGIGMHTEAKTEMDKFDLPVVPRFIRFLEWKIMHPLSDLVLTRDVVNIQDNYYWSVELTHNSHEPVTLQWNAQKLDGKSLILIDEQAKILIDMTKMNAYTFQGGSRTFTIYYSNKQTEVGEVIQMGSAYPNPANESVTIISGFNSLNSSLDARVLIRSANGTVVTSLNNASQQEGLQKIEWNLKNAAGQRVLPGVYFYELVSNCVNNQMRVNGKIIVY